MVRWGHVRVLVKGSRDQRAYVAARANPIGGKDLIGSATDMTQN